jgi:HEPN domain-containing protein
MAKKQHAGITEQHKASIHRWEDAQALFQAGRWRGAMYLAGYAVECRLKWKLMQRWQCRTLVQLEEDLQEHGIEQSPFTHNLKVLLRLAGGLERMQQNQRLWGSFSDTVNRWRPAWRYNPDVSTREQAEDFLEVAKDVLRWIDHNL